MAALKCRDTDGRRYFNRMQASPLHWLHLMFAVQSAPHYYEIWLQVNGWCIERVDNALNE